MRWSEIAEEGPDAHAAAKRAQQRVLDLQDQREAVHGEDVRLSRVDHRHVPIERVRIAKAVMDDDARRDRSGRTRLCNVERGAARRRPGAQERPLELRHGRPFHARASVQPGDFTPARPRRQPHLVEAGVVLVRQIPPADERHLAVDHGQLPVVPPFQVVKRGRGGNGIENAELDPRSSPEAVQEGIARAERSVKSMQRVDDHPHRHAAHTGLGQGRLDGAAGAIVERHVELQVNAALRGSDRLQEPAARPGVVQLDVDPVSGDQGSTGDGLEPPPEGRRFGRDRLDGDARRDLLRSQDGEADRRRGNRSVTDDRCHGEAGRAHSCGDAREAHRVEVGADVERRTLVEDGAGVDDTPGESRFLEPRADRAGVLRHAHPNGQQVDPIQARQQAKLDLRRVGIEEDQRTGGRPDHRHFLLYRRQRIPRLPPTDPVDAERIRPRRRNQLGRAVLARDRGDDAPSGDDRQRLVGDRLVATHAERVMSAQPDHAVLIDHVRHVHGGLHRPLTALERRKDEDRRPPPPRRQEGGWQTGHHHEVELARRRTGDLFHASRDSGDLQERREVVEDAADERGDANVGRRVIAQEPAHRTPGGLAESHAEDVLDRTAAGRIVRRPERGQRSPLAHLGDLGQGAGDQQIDLGCLGDVGEILGADVGLDANLDGSRGAAG